MSQATPLAARPDAPGHGVLAYAGYGLLGLPLAMAALPVYVQAPAYYVSQLGMGLGSAGWVLFLARLADTVQDPLLGHWIDRLRGGLHAWLMTAAAVLALAFFGLWLPPVGGAQLLPWLALMLFSIYTAHSMLSIAYLSWGARLQAAGAGGNAGLLGAAAWREGAGLAGVVIASLVPGIILAAPPADIAPALAWYGAGFALVLGLALLGLLRFAPPWQRDTPASGDWRLAWGKVAGNRRFRRLLLPYFINAMSVSIPATLVLFFIQDRLQEPARAGTFLAAYFVAAALGLPLWVRLAGRIGLARSWALGMLVAIAAFSSAASLGAGDGDIYLVICIAAGLALGADLALPPVLLADVISDSQATASYYGVWTLLGKLALALSGLMLPLLAAWGYQPGQAGGAALAWAYAGVPCGFKLLALLALLQFTKSGK